MSGPGVERFVAAVSRPTLRPAAARVGTVEGRTADEYGRPAVNVRFPGADETLICRVSREVYFQAVDGVQVVVVFGTPTVAVSVLADGTEEEV